mgnify:FL=1
MNVIESRAKRCLLVFAILAAIVAAGCANPQPQPESKSENGLVVILPGVEGNRWQLSGSVLGLRDAGIDLEIDIIPWGSPPFHSIPNLTNYPENQKRAERIAARIAEFKKDHPEAPVTLIGYSGGGGLAVMATEVLPDEVKLGRMILVGAAVSPDYDLTNVLSRCDHGLINFYSMADWFILGVGTQIFGTIDRKYSPSAGHVGFLDGDKKLREELGLTQIAWESDWMHSGHYGGHIGWLARAWAREYLAPTILASRHR